ncbi:MAG: hypothetical protein AVDCRST_MAG49-4509 [uncultured Thermomicrobiales bacterium]|uniref:Uncharacterized protein n=1 Tax=uncultured Thermomicrobiales bacterium TaxID=1645740 RepID=A0A6J4VGR4_9BACT|nr:MAG: hypothetical protein AVDCRST_MAG49-4509 [uncultured Thermomicrobiales bacterium]
MLDHSTMRIDPSAALGPRRRADDLAGQVGAGFRSHDDRPKPSRRIGATVLAVSPMQGAASSAAAEAWVTGPNTRASATVRTVSILRISSSLL